MGKESDYSPKKDMRLLMIGSVESTMEFSVHHEVLNDARLTT